MRSPIRTSWRTHQALKVGRLQTIGRLNVLPGDSLTIQADVKTVFAKLRRNAGISLVKETFGFYVPWRWSYGDSLITAATSGWTTATTWATTQTLTQAEDCTWMMAHGQTIPKHLVEDYAAVIEHYFKEPHQAAITSANVISDEEDQLYGYRCWQLKDHWETSLNWADSHDQQQIPDASINALDMPQYMSLGRDNQLRQWDAVRKEDIYKATYGGRFNPEALKIPSHLHYEKLPVKLSATDMEPLEQTQLASATGGGRITIPRRYYPEHGTVYLFCLVRVKPSYWHAKDYLDNTAHFGNMKKAFGHQTGNVEAPLEIKAADLFADGAANTSMGYTPWYGWLHRRPDWWSPVIRENDEGWPARDTPDTKGYMHRHPRYDDIWTSNQFGHGLIHTGLTISGHRPVSSGRSSIMGGGK